MNRPRITFRIQNYHYRTEIVRTQNGTRRRRKRVNTHFATSEFRYEQWADGSPDESAIAEAAKRMAMSRLECEKDF